jgi:periplasmic protein TonB
MHGLYMYRNQLKPNLDEFTDADYGTCIVRFVVDKTGKVSNVEATTMKGTKLEEVATNIIRRGPNWIPAQQNGRYVKAYRLQRVTILNPNQE